MDKNETRVMVDENKQKEIFTDFITKFNGNFELASKYIGISRSSLSKYKRAVVRYIPKNILEKIVNYLSIQKPEIIFSGTLTEIRRNYIKNARPILEQKYGKDWAKELTIKRDFKGIQLADFQDYVFVYLEDDYRKGLFESLYALFGSIDKAASFLGVSISRLSSWCCGKQKDYARNVEGLQFIPLGKLKLVSKALVGDHREEFSIENMEKYVSMYRMRAGNPIKNPKFGIKESPQLVRLLFHLIGDGYSGGKNDNANYKNTCKDLLEEFKEDLKIFGDIPVYEQMFSIKFPRVLAELIENFYGIDTRTFESHISSKIFKISKKNLYFGIRAYADDEGSVYSNSIRLSSANKILLEGIKKILDILKIRSNEVKFQISEKATLGKIYYLDIKDIIKYHKQIGFTHPKKKLLLEEYVQAIKSRRRKGLFKM